MPGTTVQPQTRVRRRRPRFTLVVALAAVGFIALPADPALALTETPEQDWRTTGRILAVAQLGNTLYMGGHFLKVISPTGTRHAVGNLAAFDKTTGNWIPSFTASVTNTKTSAEAKVEELAISADGNWLYVGGNFDTVNGGGAKNLAAVDTETGTVVDGDIPRVNITVRTILVGPDRVYIGGHFKSVAGQARNYLAALRPDGTLDPQWVPSANGVVHTLEWATDRQTIFVGGSFNTMNGQSRASVARVTPDTGQLHPWAIPSSLIGDNIVWDLLATPTRLYGGFGKTPNWAAAYRLDLGSSGVQVWRNNYVGNVQGLALSATGTRLYVAGHFGTAELQQQACGRNLRGLLMVDPVNGAIDCSWIPQIEPWGSNYIGAWSLLRTGTHLWVIGKFTQISGVRQGAFARFAL
jgi:hypothetical protein